MRSFPIRRPWPLLPFLVLPLLPAAGAAPGPPLSPAGTIPLPGVEGRFDHFAVDVKGQRLFAAALGNNTLEVLDLAAGKVARAVPKLREPQGVAYAPDLDRIFMGNGG